jgi:hypothetical protein
MVQVVQLKYLLLKSWHNSYRDRTEHIIRKTPDTTYERKRTEEGLRTNQIRYQKKQQRD